MLSSESDVSSKRVNGTICILTMVLLIIVAVTVDLDVKSAHENLIKMVFTGGLVLLGINAAEKIFKK